jgi:hypothetical protein
MSITLWSARIHPAARNSGMDAGRRQAALHQRSGKPSAFKSMRSLSAPLN